MSRWQIDGVPTAYKSPSGQHAVRLWCSEAIARADFPLTSMTVDTSAGQVHLTAAGAGRPRVVMVPGTGFNAAVNLPWLRALSARWPTTVVDLPGQPGLSDPRRPRRASAGWYGRLLDEVLAAAELDRIVLVGNSLGAAVALAAQSPRIAARALVSPAGFIRLTVDPKLTLASAVWLLRPTPEHTRRMLRMFVTPGQEPPETEVEWMTLMAETCRTTLAPPPLPTDLLSRRIERPCVVAVGEYDRFLPPRRLAPAVRRAMALELRVIAGMGHMTTAVHLGDVVSLVAEVADPIID
ncbi:alpha/beta hydrolase [Mycobacterium sp. RTGN5]|uniref:alpha/beta fold hydrolase n=1 Tax=Mycobacterium sp. RTGN5 TaxID=3016522 RepID=UPI0029C971F9|nr:alpha/beta hydrolase [Mycobacterium sp. RTGN5]